MFLVKEPYRWVNVLGESHACLIVAVVLLAKDIYMTRKQASEKRVQDAKNGIEQDNRLAQIEHVELLGMDSPRVKKKD